MKRRAGQVTDTGLRTGPENIRLDRAQWRAAHLADARPCCVRFHRYLPAASLGAFEISAQSLRPPYCREHGIDVVRRVSGGAAVYLNPGQLCWTLTLSRPGAWGDRQLAGWLALLCEGAAQGLRRLGVDAVFAPPNDIEVAGRKLASGFIALSDSALLFQGSLLLDQDTETMMKVLRVPTEKLTPDGVRSARHRFATVHDGGFSPEMSRIEQYLLAGWAEALEVEFGDEEEWAYGEINGGDDQAPPAGDWEADGASWHQALVKTPGGVLYIRLRLDDRAGILEQVEFAGGVQIRPAHLFGSLSSWLARTPVTFLRQRLDDFFQTHPHDMLGLGVQDIRHALHLALDRPAQQRLFDLTAPQANTLMVHAPQSQAAAVIAREASAMLVPYCAKPSWCKWRHRDGCPDCGMCEVGEAYRLARERGMQVVTITNFEHLQQTLGVLRARGARAYVGMCCRHFYLKREYAFREAGIPAVLMDITGSNCYEMQQEDLAYAGEFQAEARLDLAVLRKVMEHVPPVAGS